MCVGENAAPLATHYLNAQLMGLYENALLCVQNHNDASKPENAASIALAQFTYGKALGHGSGAQFRINLDKPELDFVCNHDAILRVRIHDGHFTHHEHKTSNDHFHDLREVDVTLRVPFKIRKIVGEDDRIGNGQSLLIRLLILDILEYKVLSIEPEINYGRDSFLKDFAKYIECLHAAGNHVMFSLPDFDNNNQRVNIDYALIERNLPWSVESIHGIAVADINKQLSLKWLKAAMLSNGPADVFDKVWRDAILAEYHSYRLVREDAGFFFHLKMGAPRVVALCPKEVVMYFNINDLSFFSDRNFSGACLHSFEGWEIAIVFDVIYSIEAEGNVTMITLDVRKPRFREHLCVCPGLDGADEAHLRYWSHIYQFFTAEYLDFIYGAGLHIIYHHDKRWNYGNIPVPKTDIPRPWLPEQDEEVPNEIIVDTHMHKFDQIIAISQQSINLHFKTLWQYAQSYLGGEYACGVVTRWHRDTEIEIDFKPLSLRLLSGNKALLWVDVSRAVVHPHPNAPWKVTKDHELENWRLAFEVDIRMDHVHDYPSWDVHGDWRKRHEAWHLWTTHGACSDRVLKYIWLDFKNATFLHDFSTFESLYDAQDSYSSINKLRAMLHYMTEHYFPALHHWGLNILYSIPVWTLGVELPSYALTDVAFEVYAKHEVTRHSWAQVAPGSEPILVVLGTTGFRPLPARTLEFNEGWLVRVNRGWAHGTLALSKQAFMEARLLKLLGRINAETTLIPRFAGVDGGVWNLDLCVWRDHAKHGERAHEFTLVGLQNGYLTYKWEHLEGWTYEHQGLGELGNGWYSVNCLTTNFLEIPASFMRGVLDIKLRGEVKLEMKYSRGANHWGASSTANWNATLALRTEVGGVKAELSGAQNLVPTPTVYTGEGARGMFRDPHELLGAHLPKVVNLESVFQELRGFEGVWEYCYPRLQGYALANPMFNAHGDLLFEVRVFGEQSVAAAGVRGPTPRVPSSAGRLTFPRSAAPSRAVSYAAASPASPAASAPVANGKNGVPNGNGMVPASAGNGSATPTRKSAVADKVPVSDEASDDAADDVESPFEA